jgi:hypothetical protein
MREALERLRILLDWQQEHGESLTRAFRDAPERPTVADLRLIADGAQQQQPSEAQPDAWLVEWDDGGKCYVTSSDPSRYNLYLGQRIVPLYRAESQPAQRTQGRRNSGYK